MDLLSPRQRRERQFLPRAPRLRLLWSKIFFRIFLACFITALAGPRWGLNRTAGEYRRGLDTVIAVDVSLSMEIEDAQSPERGVKMSRLERGLALARDAAAAVSGGRFAAAVSRGRGLVAVPLTWDNSAVFTFLEALDSSSLTGRGTNLESLIDAAAGAFHASFPSRKAILLVSDGESLSGSVKAAVDRCAAENISIAALGVGSDEGAPVPGQESTISRRDAALLRMIADRSGGIYVDGSRADASDALASYLRSLAPESERPGNRRERKERWFLFIMAALLAFCASKLSLAQIPGLKRRVTNAALVFSCLLFLSCARVSGKLLIMEANFLCARSRHNEAIPAYLKALEYEDAAPYAEYGLGLAYYNLDEGGAALERYADSLELLENRQAASHRELRYRIHYNTGVARFSADDFDGAAFSFREALRTNPASIEAKRNLELSLLLIARKNAARSQAEKRSEEKESRAAFFEYVQQKEQNQWKSREWTLEEESPGPDY
jgi:Ca-activated chloride channel family protein